MLAVKQRWFDVLKKTAIFSLLTDEQLAVVVSFLFYYEVEAGQTLVYEGELGFELFIIVEGCVSIFVNSEKAPIELGRLYQGDFFGEMALLEQTSRSASCNAVENTACFLLKATDFSRLIESEPAIGMLILKKMLEGTVSRLMKTNSFLTQIIQWGHEAKQRAITDPFTGLFNRRYLDNNIEDFIMHHAETGLHFAMVDVDRFGMLNNRYGSEFCDKLLLAIADAFKKTIHTDDCIIRYGGDEFCFIIYGDALAAKAVCEKVCIEVHSRRFSEHPELAASCSIGLVSCIPMERPEGLFKRADSALYRAKEQGRNQVVYEADEHACSGDQQ